MNSYWKEKSWFVVVDVVDQFQIYYMFQIETQIQMFIS